MRVKWDVCVITVALNNHDLSFVDPSTSTPPPRTHRPVLVCKLTTAATHFLLSCVEMKRFC